MDVLCETCEKGICYKCRNGFFLYKNKCLKSCPIGLRANRVNFSCEEKFKFAFYWIFPSVYSCKDKCGIHAFQADCSCKYSCLRRGNCCDDFEKECKQELKKEDCKLCQEFSYTGECLKCKQNSSLSSSHPGQCLCAKGFLYNIEEDICMPETVENSGKFKFFFS